MEKIAWSSDACAWGSVRALSSSSRSLVNASRMITSARCTASAGASAWKSSASTGYLRYDPCPWQSGSDGFDRPSHSERLLSVPSYKRAAVRIWHAERSQRVRELDRLDEVRCVRNLADDLHPVLPLEKTVDPDKVVSPAPVQDKD